MKLTSYVRSLAGCLLVALLVGACRNEATEPTPTTPRSGRQCALRALSYTADVNLGSGVISASATAALDYNAQNQVSRIVTTYAVGKLGSLTNTDEITYSPGQIVAQTKASVLDFDGVATTVYTLNSAGLIGKRTQTFSRANGNPTTNTVSYEYDADGYRVKDVLADGSAVAYAYTNGNVSTITYFSKDGAKQNVVTLTYYDDKPLNTATNGGVNAEAAFYAAGLLGKPNRNPVKSTTSPLRSSENLTFDYVYDTDNNIVTVTQQGAANPVALKVNYAYTCR